MSIIYINLLLCLFALIIGGIASCLSLLFHSRNSYVWTKYYCIFQSSLYVSLFFYAIKIYATGNFNFSNNLFYSIVLFIILIDTAFLIIFIPYFITWLIAHPWRNPYKVVFKSCSCVFMLCSVLFLLNPQNKITGYIMLLIFLSVFFFSIGVLGKHIESIKNKEVRRISFLFIVLSVAMVPFTIFDVVFNRINLLSLPIYYICFNIVILVYLISYFMHLPKNKDIYISSDVLERMHITSREKEVIECIKMGMTSKEIAAKLFISTNTVNNHIANIYSKTGIRSRIDILNLFYSSR